MTWGKKYWADGGAVVGQQFQYGFDDIGNRRTTGIVVAATGQAATVTRLPLGPRLNT